MSYNFDIELDREDDGRWIAEIVALPGVMAYGATEEDAIRRVRALALRVLADRISEDTQNVQAHELVVSLACSR
jgi:predicted RNase H-like HicB family nuclease